MTNEPRCFLAVDLGSATTSASLIGRVGGHWRLIGSLSFPSEVSSGAVVDLLVERARVADPDLAAEIGLPERDASRALPRLVARSTAPTELAVLAITERALTALLGVVEPAGWRIRGASLERADAIALTELLLDPSVSTVLAAVGEPPAADERGRLDELAGIVSAAAIRRPELEVVLAGSMSQFLAQIERRNNGTAKERVGKVVQGPPPGAGEPPGSALRALVERLRAPADDSRNAFIRAASSLANALDRRIEAIDVGLNAAVRVVASPGVAGEPGTLVWGVTADAGLAPVDPDEGIVDGVLGWSTVPIDRHRMRDRLRELRLSPWSDAAGEGAPFRLAAARAAVRRLLAATPEIDRQPPADLLVVSGGAWAVAPGPAIALAVADVVRRPGVCQLAFDHARLLGPLGTIEDGRERRLMVRDLSDDLLVPLGSVVMPQGLRPGRSGGRLVVHGTAGSTELDLAPGGLELVDLPPGESAVAEFQFRESVRIGARGRHFAIDVAGGLGGLLVDLRDVPLRLPERADRRQELLAAWQEALWAGVET